MIFGITGGADKGIITFDASERASLAIVSVLEKSLIAKTFAIDWGWISVLASVAGRAGLSI